MLGKSTLLPRTWRHADVDTGEGREGGRVKTGIYHVVYSCVCKRQNCQLVDNNNVNNNVASSVWAGDKPEQRKHRTAGGQHCTIIIRLCKWEKVMLWILNPALQRPRKHVTPHGSLFVDKPNSFAGWKSVAKQAGAVAATCPSSKLSCRKIWGLTRKLMALLGYNVSEEERESTFTSVSR